MKIIKEIKECLTIKRILKNSLYTKRQKELITKLKKQGIDVKIANPHAGKGI